MKHLLLLGAMLLVTRAASAADFTYTRDTSWPGELPKGWKYRMAGNVSGDSKGNIYVVHRGEHPLLRFDKNGKFVAALGDDFFRKSVNYNLTVDPPTPISSEYWLHGLFVDHEANIWVTDIGRQVVMKVSPEGKLLLTLGTLDVKGTDEKTFHQPSAVTVAKTGHIYVADGYGNSRVVKFAPDGKYIKAWGKKGTGHGEFNTPHGIAVGAEGNVYVAERVNSRVQVFDPDGRHLAYWTDFAGPDSIRLASDGTFFVGTGRLDPRLFHVDAKGKRLQSIGEMAVTGYPHGFHVDSAGSLYIADPVSDDAARPPRKFRRN